jgi:catechol 2,3-dioxygenase-like lactoylglutathione lyase family enzyme
MEKVQLHRGRMVDHIQLVVRDFEACRAFYVAIFKVLDIPIFDNIEGTFWADELVVSSVTSPASQGELTGRHHIAFQAKDRAVVDAFYSQAMRYGGRDNGAPGERPYHPGYYAAFVLDPAGNNIEAVYHGDAKRSAPSVTIEFEM